MTISVKDSGGSDVTVKTIDDLAADGGQVTIGAKADTAVTAVDTTPGSVVALLKGIISKLAGTLTVAAHAVTNAGTFAVQNTAATPAGTNIVGKVGIDQTTDGTTNLVSAKQNGTWNVTNISGTISLPTGAATAANQSTGNTSLASLVTALGSITNTGNALDVNVKSGVNGNGRTTPSGSAPVVAASQTGQFVAASTSAGQLGSTGSAADYLDGILVIPGTTAAGAVSILWDGTNTRQVFAGGGTTALTTLIPFYIPIGIVSGNSGGFKITTGSNVTCVAVGNFT